MILKPKPTEKNIISAFKYIESLKEKTYITTAQICRNANLSRPTVESIIKMPAKIDKRLALKNTSAISLHLVINELGGDISEYMDLLMPVEIVVNDKKDISETKYETSVNEDNDSKENDNDLVPDDFFNKT